MPLGCGGLEDTAKLLVQARMAGGGEGDRDRRVQSPRASEQRAIARRRCQTQLEYFGGLGVSLDRCHLPDGDGISLIVRLRELPQYRDTPIVVVSADLGGGREDLRSANLKVSDWLYKPIDFDRLIRVLTGPAVKDVNRRPRILHVDDDNAVAQALSKIGDVVSVNSIEQAQRALRADDFDLAVIDMAHAAGTNLGLLPDLRDGKGNAIPVVVFSGQSRISAPLSVV